MYSSDMIIIENMHLIYNSSLLRNPVQWLVFIIPALERLRQEDGQAFKARLDYSKTLQNQTM